MEENSIDFFQGARSNILSHIHVTHFFSTRNIFSKCAASIFPFYEYMFLFASYHRTHLNVLLAPCPYSYTGQDDLAFGATRVIVLGTGSTYLLEDYV